MTRRPFLTRLLADEQGATITEFALILPAFAMVLLGSFDFAYNYYAETMIEGAVQKAARDSSLQMHANNYAALDTRVRKAVKRIVPSATVAFKRSGYENFSDVGRPETFDDANKDGVCNDGEKFEDANNNGSWDANRARSNTGNARDAILYEVTATYPRAFPIPGLAGLEPKASVVARTVIRNQPFGASLKPGVGNCP